jgi:hypothetical protein
MLEQLMERGRAAAERNAERRRARLARDLRELMPEGVRAETIEQGVALCGRGLKRRFAVDAELRALAERLK